MLIGRLDLSFVKCFSQFLPVFLFISTSFIKKLEGLTSDVSTEMFMLDESVAKYTKSRGKNEISQ